MSDTDVSNKLFLITGATSGIGKAAAQAIAAQGGRVVIVGRNPQKTAATVAEIKQISGSPAVEYLLADLSSMQETRSLAQQFQQKYDRLDVLINNAGGFFMRRQETVDGLEMTFALNHLSYFLLTNLLLDMLKASRLAKHRARAPREAGSSTYPQGQKAAPSPTGMTCR